MPEQKPEFEVPEATKQMTKQELDMQLPLDETAVIYSGLREVFYEEAGATMTKTRARQQSTAKRTQARQK